MVTINSRKYDRSIRRSWKCQLIEKNDSLLLFEGKFEEDIFHSELGLIRRGTISHEFYWLDRWYNIFRFREPDGVLRNWYCNICMPPTFENKVLDYIDLDIDVLVSPEFDHRILDLEDFARNSAAFDYSKEVKVKVRESLDQLLNLIKLSEFPFSGTDF